MKMRELERRSGVGRETIRFYLKEGLLPQPERPYPRVAIYSQVHLDRIRQIKALQGDPNLNLGLIKRLLAGQTSSVTAERAGLNMMIAERLELSPRSQVALASLKSEDPAYGHYVEELVLLGVVTIQGAEGSQWLDALEAEIVRVWADGRQAAGYREDLGFGPAGILPYVNAIDGLVRTVLDAFLYRVSGKVDESRILEMADAGLIAVDRLLPLLFRQSMLRVAREKAPARPDAKDSGLR